MHVVDKNFDMVKGGRGHACQILGRIGVSFVIIFMVSDLEKAVHIFDVIHHRGIKFQSFQSFNKRVFQLILPNAFPTPTKNPLR